MAIRPLADPFSTREHAVGSVVANALWGVAATLLAGLAAWSTLPYWVG
jgi:hypothetical protein